MARSFDTILDSIEGNEDADLYTQIDDPKDPNNGKFRFSALNPKHGVSLGRMEATLTALEHERKNSVKNAKALEVYRDEHGDLLDVSAFQDAQERLKTMEGMVDKDKVEELVKGRVADIEKQFAKELEVSRSNEKSLTQQLFDKTVNVDAIAAIAAMGATEYADALLPSLLPSLKVEPAENGTPARTIVVDAEGNKRIILDESGAPRDMGAADRLLEMKELAAFAPLLNSGSGLSGSGGPAASGGGTQGRHVFSRQGSHEEFKRAHAAAKDAGAELQITD